MRDRFAQGFDGVTLNQPDRNEMTRTGVTELAIAAPQVDIRVATFTIAGGALFVLLDRADGIQQLPRSAPSRFESIDLQARDSLRAHLGAPEQYMEQLYTLTVVEGGVWRIVVSYVALLSTADQLIEPLAGRWEAATALDQLSAGDALVFEYALFRVRSKLDYTTIGFNLLPAEFTLGELQSAYETVLGHELDKRNFRRRMSALGILTVTGTTRRDGSHRPARLYRYQPDRDSSDYLTPPWATAQEGT
jgi:8-oxo-dGTP diphosphatase